jgi:chitinase
MSLTTFRTSLTAGMTALVLAALPLGVALAYTITATASPPDAGVVTLAPVKTNYAKNNVVTVTAQATKSGWKFDHWEGALSGSQNPTTLRVSTDAKVTGVFIDTTVPGPVREPPPAAHLVVGYFTQWSIYRRGYLVRQVHTSGSADALDVINYAFAAPDASLRCASLDAFADYGKRFDASESVDGVADTVSQPLKGNFNQLLKLKKKHPQLHVLLSLGGWTQSFRFSDLALSDESRKTFVSSCIATFMREVAPGISVEGVFDGFDIDWEYPGSCGETCAWRPGDAANFRALLKEFRTQLDQLATAQGRTTPYLLTIAAPAGAADYGPLDISVQNPIDTSLDWINVMAYDFHGSWETAGPSNHHAALYPSPCKPADVDWGERAIKAYRDAGVPASKLVLGVPFYGRGWRVASVGDGLCVPASGIPRGTWERGIEDYKVLAAQGRVDFYDSATGPVTAHWTFNGSEFWSYDDEHSLDGKAKWVNGEALREGQQVPTGIPLRGMMFWELSGDASDARLLRSLCTSLRGSAASCQP